MFFKGRRSKYKPAYALNTQHVLNCSCLYRDFSLFMEIWFKIMEKSWKSTGQNVSEPCNVELYLPSPSSLTEEHPCDVCKAGRPTGFLIPIFQDYKYVNTVYWQLFDDQLTVSIFLVLSLSSTMVN